MEPPTSRKKHIMTSSIRRPQPGDRVRKLADIHGRTIARFAVTRVAFNMKGDYRDILALWSMDMKWMARCASTRRRLSTMTAVTCLDLWSATRQPHRLVSWPGGRDALRRGRLARSP